MSVHGVSCEWLVKRLSPLCAPIALLACLVTSTSTLAAETAPGSLESYECLIEPMVTVALGSETQGLIDRLIVDRGDLVSKGDIVATLKSSVETRKVEQATKRAAMDGEVMARKADLELARLVLDRAASMHKQQLVPAQELDEAKAQHRVAQAAMQQAEDNKSQLALELLVAQSLQAQRVVRSPIDGVVVQQHAFQGEFVNDNPIITIAQLNPLRVEIVLSLEKFGQYKAGDMALIRPELGGEAVAGIVDVVDPLLDSGSGTFGVRVLVNNDAGTLIAGQKCTVSLSSVGVRNIVSAEEQR